MNTFRIEVEEFRRMPSNPNYLVSDHGRVYSKRRLRKFLKPWVAGNGYFEIRIFGDGPSRRISLHKLVMEVFVGETQGGRAAKHKYQNVNHKDGNKLNNKLANLEYCTLSENLKHAWAMGLKTGRLKKEDIAQIHNHILQNRLTQKEIGKLFNVTGVRIGQIKKAMQKSNLV